MASQGLFACSNCGMMHDTKEEAEQCCKTEKIGHLCSACGKSHSEKKGAISCCTQVKKRFDKRGA
ncbi:MAG TPA: hypothetical protein VI977_01940 [archaeon]|nr:hypothetical protein [archaeon]